VQVGELRKAAAAALARSYLAFKSFEIAWCCVPSLADARASPLKRSGHDAHATQPSARSSDAKAQPPASKPSRHDEHDKQRTGRSSDGEAQPPAPEISRPGTPVEQDPERSSLASPQQPAPEPSRQHSPDTQCTGRSPSAEAQQPCPERPHRDTPTAQHLGRSSDVDAQLANPEASKHDTPAAQYSGRCPGVSAQPANPEHAQHDTPAAQHSGRTPDVDGKQSSPEPLHYGTPAAQDSVRTPDATPLTASPFQHGTPARHSGTSSVDNPHPISPKSLQQSSHQCECPTLAMAQPHRSLSTDALTSTSHPCEKADAVGHLSPLQPPEKAAPSSRADANDEHPPSGEQPAHPSRNGQVLVTVDTDTTASPSVSQLPGQGTPTPSVPPRPCSLSPLAPPTKRGCAAAEPSVQTPGAPALVFTETESVQPPVQQRPPERSAPASQLDKSPSTSLQHCCKRLISPSQQPAIPCDSPVATCVQRRHGALHSATSSTVSAAQDASSEATLSATLSADVKGQPGIRTLAPPCALGASEAAEDSAATVHAGNGGGALRDAGACTQRGACAARSLNRAVDTDAEPPEARADGVLGATRPSNRAADSDLPEMRAGKGLCGIRPRKGAAYTPPPEPPAGEGPGAARPGIGAVTMEPVEARLEDSEPGAIGKRPFVDGLLPDDGVPLAKILPTPDGSAVRMLRAMMPCNLRNTLLKDLSLRIHSPLS
jgi:hypothetical protein